jgi:endogenous inhibitor of DNA gyrase (YacG/DUF329 family)
MTCPVCRRPSHPAHKPFCSKRCADVDLGRWLNDSYRLPVPAGQEDEEGGGKD